jgi:hypothetical protein
MSSDRVAQPEFVSPAKRVARTSARYHIGIDPPDDEPLQLQYQVVICPAMARSANAPALSETTSSRSSAHQQDLERLTKKRPHAELSAKSLATGTTLDPPRTKRDPTLDAVVSGPPRTTSENKEGSEFPATFPHKLGSAGKIPTHSVTCEQSSRLTKAMGLTWSAGITAGVMVTELFCCADPKWPGHDLDRLG